MRRAVGPLCALFLLLYGGSFLRAAAPRAIWVWEIESYRMIDEPAYTSTALEFCVQKKITAVYFYADELKGRNALLQQAGRYRDSLSAMHARGGNEAFGGFAIEHFAAYLEWSAWRSSAPLPPTP